MSDEYTRFSERMEQPYEPEERFCECERIVNFCQCCGGKLRWLQSTGLFPELQEEFAELKRLSPELVEYLIERAQGG